MQIIHGDCREVLPTLPAGSVDCVVTDPPYPKEYDHVWDIMSREVPRVMRVGGFLATFCGHYQVPRVMDAMRDGGLTWFWSCVVGNRDQPIMHGFRAKCCHKPCLVFTKGRGRPRRIFYDDFSLRTKTSEWGRSQALHKWGQATSLFYEPVDAFCPEMGIVLDPFMGSGSVGMICLGTGREFIGIEMDRGFFALARERLVEADSGGPLFRKVVVHSDLFTALPEAAS